MRNKDWFKEYLIDLADAIIWGVKWGMVIIIITYVWIACCHSKEECKNISNRHLQLIGYKVATHSHLYFKVIETEEEIDIGSVGGRRVPIIEIGDTIPVQYCNETGRIFFDRYQYVKHPVGADRESRIVGRTAVGCYD